MSAFQALGNKQTKFEAFEAFARPDNCSRVVCVSDEVTAMCPVTGQPDWYVVTIDYIPGALCVESKTLKLYLQSFRNAGLFCEAFADKIAQDIWNGIKPLTVTVTVKQKPRGGVAIEATARL